MADKSLYGVEETVKLVAETGVGKSDVSLPRLLFSGFMAGAYIAFAFFLSIVAAASFSHLGPHYHYSLYKVMLGIFFPFGLVAVVIGGAELWTGNVQFSSTAALQGKISKRHTLYNWIVSYTGNFAGAFFLAFLVTVGGGIISSHKLLSEVVTQAALTKSGGGFFPLLWLGVGCNWLVNLAIWLSFKGKDAAGKVILLWFPVFGFVAMGFEHSIANMWIFSSALLLPGGGVDWGMVMDNLVPVTLGNALGGFFFVSFYHWFLYDGKKAIRKVFDYLGVTTAFIVLVGVFPLGVVKMIPGFSKAPYFFPLFYSLYGTALGFVLLRQVNKGKKEKKK